MSALRLATPRRRSHSTSGSPSPSPVSRRIGDSSWRASNKRAHPAHASGPWPSDHSSPHKWDVEIWRRGKRARRDASPDLNMGGGALMRGHRQSMSTDTHSSMSDSARSAPASPGFATTSAEFHLFPKDERKTRRASFRFDPALSSSRADPFLDNQELARLRSDAFWELKRSVAESGEGFIRRMRDYENVRSKTGVHASRSTGPQRRTRKRQSQGSPQHRDPPPPPTWTGSDDDDDEVQILAGDGATTNSSPSGWSPRKKRAFSLDTMDVDTPAAFAFTPAPVSPGYRGSSPGATCDSSPSEFDDDDFHASLPDPRHTFEAHPERRIPFTASSPPLAAADAPPLSYTRSNSTNSSQVSLPLAPAFSLASSSAYTSSSSTGSRARPIARLPSSRSEKALAALSLAMENGAGSLNDYEALRAVHAPPILEDAQVGELWH